MKEKAGIGIADATVAQRNPSHSVICWRANLKVVDVSGRKISIEFARHLPESIKKVVPILPVSDSADGPSWEK